MISEGYKMNNDKYTYCFIIVNLKIHVPRSLFGYPIYIPLLYSGAFQ